MEYYLLVSIVSLFVGAGAVLFLHRKQSNKNFHELSAAEARTRDLEKQIHIKERDFIDEKNKIETAHHEAIKTIRENSYKDGFDHGMAEKEKDHLIAITNLNSKYLEDVRKECARAAQEARNELKADLDKKGKIFSVSIRPYVKTIKNSGVFYDDYSSDVGYQYQLLVNGIPAFSPHIIVEKTEAVSDFKEENMKYLIEQAKEAAKIAVKVYLGDVSSMFNLIDAPVINQITT